MTERSFLDMTDEELKKFRDWLAAPERREELMELTRKKAVETQRKIDTCQCCYCRSQLRF